MKTLTILALVFSKIRIFSSTSRFWEVGVRTWKLWANNQKVKNDHRRMYSVWEHFPLSPNHISLVICLGSGYHGSMQVYMEMGELARRSSSTANGEKLAYHPLDMNRETTLCLGKEWYRFPSSFFLPSAKWQVGLLRSEFRGLLPKPYARGPNATALVPADMNDRNREEISRYARALSARTHPRTTEHRLWMRRWKKKSCRVGVTSWHHWIAEDSRFSKMLLILFKSQLFIWKLKKRALSGSETVDATIGVFGRPPTIDKFQPQLLEIWSRLTHQLLKLQIFLPKKGKCWEVGAGDWQSMPDIFFCFFWVADEQVLGEG